MFFYNALGVTLSVCICSKCGSTSLFQLLHRAVSGPEHELPSNIWDYVGWGIPSVSDSQKIGDYHIIIYRDPYERYISAYRSKLQCCDDGVSACYFDRDHLYDHLTYLAGMKIQKKCLTFTEYERALQRIFDQNLERTLDPHFRPQHYWCDFSNENSSSKIIYTKVSTFDSVLNSLNIPGLKKLRIGHTHKTAHNELPHSTIIENISRSEYETFNRLGLKL